MKKIHEKECINLYFEKKKINCRIFKDFYSSSLIKLMCSDTDSTYIKFIILMYENLTS